LFGKLTNTASCFIDAGSTGMKPVVRQFAAFRVTFF